MAFGTCRKGKISQAFSPYGRDPTQVGDKGYARPSDYHIGRINKLGDVPSNWKQRGNLTPLVFHPISKAKSEERDYDQLTHAGGPTGVKIIQTAKQPKEDEASRLTACPAPDASDARLGLMRRGWLGCATSFAQPSVTPFAEDDRTSMEIDKEGKIIHHASKTGKHVMTVDEDGKKMTLRVPVSDRKIWIGGSGKKPSLYQPVGVNVMVKVVAEDD